MAIVPNAKLLCQLKLDMEKYQKYLFNFVLNAGLKLMAVFGMRRRKNGINNER